MSIKKYEQMYTKRADGLFMARYTGTDGKRHYLYDRDASKLHLKLLNATTSHSERFCDVLSAWECNHITQLERGSQAAYKCLIDVARNEIGNKRIDEIVPADINRIMLQEKEAGKSYKHAAGVKSVIKQVFDYAIINGIVTINPTASVKVPRGMTKRKVEAPKETDINKIVSGFSNPGGAFAAMLYYTGVRTEEAVALRWSDITENEINISRAADLHGTPKIKQTKTENSVRSVPILDEHRPFLIMPEKAEKTDLVFPNRDGNMMTRGQVNTLWRNWCIASGLAYQVERTDRHRGEKECVRKEWRFLVNPHQLRHNYATVLFEAGIDDLTAQKLLGHADITTTRSIYTSLREKHMNSQVEKLNAAFRMV